MIQDSEERRKPTGLLYHYTTANGLLGILESDTLRATHVRYLNDRKEFVEALDHVDSLLVEFEQRHHRDLRSHLSSAAINFRDEFGVFTVSFTDDENQLNISGLTPGDRLSQWLSYSGDAGGFSLGFDPNVLEKSNWKDGWIVKGSVAYLSDCVYQREEKHRLLDQLGKLPNESLQWSLLVCAAIFKHPAFFNEQEWRIVVAGDPNGGSENGTGLPVKFRNGVFGVTPYVELPLRLKSADSPLRKITVGPTPHMEEAVEAVKSILDANGIKEVEVSKSDIPYRIG